MPSLSFNEVKRIQGITVRANGLLDDLFAKYANRLDKRFDPLPAQIHEAHQFRMHVEHVSVALIDIAKFRAADLFGDTDSSEGVVLRKLDKDRELKHILEAIVSLNGHQGLGHGTIKEIAKLVSKQPAIVASVKAKLEKKIDAMVAKCYREGRNAMDIIRHLNAPQPQCMFVVA